MAEVDSEAAEEMAAVEAAPGKISEMIGEQLFFFGSSLFSMGNNIYPGSLCPL